MFRKIVFTLMIAVFVSTVAVAPAFAAGQDKVTVCHKPGTDEEATLEIGAPAEAAHLGHGDYAGPCREPQSEGCDALNTVVPDAQTDPYGYFFILMNLAFNPGEVIHFDITITMDDVADNFGQINAAIVGNTLLAVGQALPGTGEQATVAFDYVVVDGDGASVVGVDVIATEGFTLDAINFSCTPA